MQANRQRVMLAAPALVLLLLFVSAAGTEAQVEAPEIQLRKLPDNPLEPALNVLSDSAWLVVQGADFRLDEGMVKAVKEFDSRLQAPGGGAASVPYREPAPKFSRNILVSRDLGRLQFQTEPHIAVNPNNPDHIVIGMIDYNLPGSAAYVSIDGGATWEGPFQAGYLRQDLVSAGDPTVGFDRRGNVYFAHISVGREEFTIGATSFAASISSIAVASSVDGGFGWLEPANVARSKVVVEEDELEVGFLDKPWMAIGPDPEDPGRDIIYVTYTHFKVRWPIIPVLERLFVFGTPVVETTIELARSVDGGASWSKPIAVSPAASYIFGGLTKRVVQGSQPAVAPDGTLYVAWLDTTGDGPAVGDALIKVARSDDGGITFARPETAARVLELGRAREHSFRSWGAALPQMAAGPAGEVYVVFAAKPPDKPQDDGDIYFVRSLDRGKTWSRPLRLNDDDTDRFQFFPAIAVGPDGTVHVMWGDFRLSPRGESYHIFYTSSDDGGLTWGPNARVSDFPSNPNYGFPFGLFIGDYFSIAATKEDVYMAWADTRLGEFGPLNQKIGFARKRLMPQPSIFISPPRGPSGQDVVIQGFNFQPVQDIFIKVGGVFVATARTGTEGRFEARIFIPITGEGAQDIVVLDASGNQALGSFFTEFGFGSIRDILREGPDQLLILTVFIVAAVALAASVLALIALRRSPRW